MDFFLELLVNGVLTGILYALIGLGLVFVYKASGVLNFAQGEMVLIAGFFVAMAAHFGLPVWAAIGVGVVVAVLMGLAAERLVLRPLVAQPIIALIMATLGFALVLRGIDFSISNLWPIYTLNIGIPKETVHWGPISVLQPAVVGAAVGLLLVAAMGYFFVRTRMGLALRAVSDDHTAALSVGISIRTLWKLVWVIAGLVALVGGLVWGTLIGVQFSIALMALKAFPVIILGGMDSMLGAILAGLFVGVSENIVAGYLDPLIGGGTKEFFPYFLMLIALWVRPYGFFGREIIERI